MYVNHLCSAFFPSFSYSLTRGTYSDTNIPMPVPGKDWYALLYPKNEWPNRTISDSGQRKRPFIPSSPRRTNRPRVNKKTMDPTDQLSCHFNKALAHTPRVIVSKSLPACQLHRQANMQVNKDTNHPRGGRKHLYECRDCGVALCIPCWEAYHRIECFEKSDYVTILST